MAKKSPKHFFSKLASVSMPRSSFDVSFTDTVTYTTDYLYPACKPLLVMPGDTYSLSYSNFVRMLSPLTVPMMDNLYMDVFWFYNPFRLVWDNTKNFFGEQRRPDDPTDFIIPQVKFDTTPAPTDKGYVPETTPFKGLPQSRSIYDYFDLPIVGTDNVLSHEFTCNALPLRCYNLIYDEWFRDEQRCPYSYYNFGNDETTADKYHLLKRGKRFDYYTSTLLEPQIGDPVDIPLGTKAPVTAGEPNEFNDIISNKHVTFAQNPGVPFNDPNHQNLVVKAGSMGIDFSGSAAAQVPNIKFDNLYADLSTATPATIATLRQAFQLQAYNEINARNGERYTEYLYGQYGVISPDGRLQRPEFLGSVHLQIQTSPIVQNSSSDGTTPQGNLSAIATGGTSEHVFTRSFTEHGYIIALCNIYSDLTYFQGLDNIWSTKTPLDLPLPVFGNLTDEAVTKGSLVFTGDPVHDNETLGYGERYSWRKFGRNSLRGLVRPTAPLTVGQWSLAQIFEKDIANNQAFIESDTPIDRITAIADQPNFIVNQLFNINLVTELPAYANPEHFMFRN